MSVASSIIETGCEAITDRKTNCFIVTLTNLIGILSTVYLWAFIIFAIMGKNIYGKMDNTFLP